MTVVSLARSAAGPEQPKPARQCPPLLLDALVPRPALQRLLCDGTVPLTLLAGPPGSGRTTLLAAHHDALQRQGTPVRWLTLSPEHNDTALLSRHLEDASGMRADPSTTAPTTFIDGLEHLVDARAHALASSALLDAARHGQAFATTDRLRGTGLHDARLRGAIALIGPEALRMDDTEATAMLGPAWQPTQVRRLCRAVDGWSAGLRFLARAPEVCGRWLADGGDEAACPPEMADYFDDVVCARQAPEMLAALTEFAVLDRFSPQMLADMPGAPGNWDLVEAQVRAGLFLRHVDDGQDWVMFHPAFGRHLRQRLRRTRPARHDALRHFAATWSGARGLGAQTLRHAVTLVERPLAAHLIEKAGAINVDLADGPDVWLGEYLPPDRAAELPLLYIGQIYHRIRRGRHEEARTAFEQASLLTGGFTRLRADADRDVVRTWAQLYEVVFLVSDDQPVDALRIATLEADLRRHLGQQPILAAGIASVLAFAYLDLSRHVESNAICNIGLHAQHASGPNKVAIFLRIHQAANAIARDTVDKAVLCIDDALRLAHIEGHADSYEVLSSQLMRGILHYENNELVAAQTLLAPALERIRLVNGWVRLYAEAFATAAAATHALDGLEQAEAILRIGEAFAHERRLPRLSMLLKVTWLRELSRAGDWHRAMALLDSAPLAALLEDDSVSPYLLVQQIPALLAAAGLMLDLGRPRDAAAHLDRINKAFLEEADSRLRFSFHILTMRAAQALRRYRSAAEHMQAAVDLARHAGLARRALEERGHILDVMDWARRSGRRLSAAVCAHVDQVLRPASGNESSGVLLQHQPRGNPAIAGGNLMLSPRESEIVALMAEGCINKEIAARLGISEGTVKTHRKKIHEKLGVANRSQAIQRARDLLII